MRSAFSSLTWNFCCHSMRTAEVYFPEEEYSHELLCFFLEAKKVNITVISRKLCPERVPAYSQAGTSEVWSSQGWQFHCRSFDPLIPACAASLSKPLACPIELFLPSSFKKWDMLHSTHGQKCSGSFSDSGESLTPLSPAGGGKPIYQPQAALSSLQPLLSQILGLADSQTFTCLGSKFLRPQYSL